MSKVILVLHRENKIFFGDILSENVGEDGSCKVRYSERGKLHEITIREYQSRKIGEIGILFAN